MTETNTTGSESEWERELDERWYLHTKWSTHGNEYAWVTVGEEVKQFIRETIATEVAKAKKDIRKHTLSNFRRIEYMANDTSASGIREERMLWLNEYLMTLE